MSAKFFEEFGKFTEAMMELPFAATRHLVGAAVEDEVQAVGWKAYDAWVRLANQATEDMYGSQAFGTAVGTSMEQALKWQRVGSAMAGAFFGALWPAIGLPTAAELNDLRAEVRALRDEVAESRLEAEEARATTRAHVRPAEQPVYDALAAMRNGWIPTMAAFASEGMHDDATAAN